MSGLRRQVSTPVTMALPVAPGPCQAQGTTSKLSSSVSSKSTLVSGSEYIWWLSSAISRESSDGLRDTEGAERV